VVAVTRIKFFEKSGARLNIPASVVRSPGFPFEDDDLVKIEIGNDSLIIEKPEWWEMLDWNEMRNAYNALPDEIKEKIAEH